MANPNPSSTSTSATQPKKSNNLVGFNDGYNFVLWFICLGALLGFALARLQFLDFHGTFCSPIPKSKFNHAAPGECFYFLQEPYTTGIRLHLGTILPTALLVCIQFTPVIRQKTPTIHRIVGYIVITLSIVSMTGVFVIIPQSFGGGLDAQALNYTLMVAFIWALGMGAASIQRGRVSKHREWMLRAWFWAGSIITGRMISFIILNIPRSEPLYYAMPCDKIDSILKSRTLELYPQCANFYSGKHSDQTVTVRAELKHPTSAVEVAAALDSVFGIANILAFFIHILGVEIYLRVTQTAPKR
ncbi:hypothetical protein O1611_g6920 [Lasiodiplodia mahajangana]|uniref:Uncharacterized protein n=1 Tax=Lasiodiplodia mahajangana TaxID=1108764 RepID=A0ACC2JHK5_9PEZI|nr:hypothetical protein O1611_g6920 [Lasiodiplodia mahajangana]